MKCKLRAKELSMSGGITISMHRQQTSRCVLAPLSSWTTTRYMVVGKYGLLAQKRGLKDADNGRVNNLTFPCSPPWLRYDSHLSLLSEPSHLTSILERVSKPHHSDGGVSATSSTSPVWPQN